MVKPLFSIIWDDIFKTMYVFFISVGIPQLFGKIVEIKKGTWTFIKSCIPHYSY